LKALEDLNTVTGSKSDVEERRKQAAAELKKFEEGIFHNKAEIAWYEEIGPGKSQDQLIRFANAKAEREHLSNAEMPDLSNYEKWDRLKRAYLATDVEWRKLPADEARKQTASEAAQREADRAARRAEENETFITEQRREVDLRRAQFQERKEADAKIGELERDTAKAKLAGAEGKTPIAADINRAAELVRKGQMSGMGLFGGLSPDEQQFLIDMDKRATGAQNGNLGHAGRVFGGAGAGMNPERFTELAEHMANLARVLQDAATARAINQGGSADDAARLQMVRDAGAMQNRSDMTTQEAVNVFARVGQNQESLYAALASLRSKLDEMDSRYGSAVNNR
jgi:hypothetical protein